LVAGEIEKMGGIAAFFQISLRSILVDLVFALKSNQILYKVTDPAQ